jgi:hypothetical protein
MPFFNNSAAIAATFKTTSTLNTSNNANTGSEKKNWNGVETRKTELVKEVIPISVTVLQLAFPRTADNYYKDLNKATKEQALKAILSILETKRRKLH